MGWSTNFIRRSIDNLRLNQKDKQSNHPTPLYLKRLRHEAEEIAAKLTILRAGSHRSIIDISRGIHGRRRAGSGDNFWQYRNYSSGDLQTSIDWRRSAQSDHLFVQQKEWESAHNVGIWCDFSGSMCFASHASLPLKRDRAIVIALTIARLFLNGGERVAYADGISLKNYMGRYAIDYLCHTMAHHLNVGQKSYPTVPSSKLAHAVFVSDFLTDSQALEKTLSGFSALGITGHLIQILDPAEIEFPFKGRATFHGLEGETPQLVPSAEAIRKSYLAKLESHSAKIESIAKQAGWIVLRHRTDEPVTKALVPMITEQASRAGPHIAATTIQSPNSTLRAPRL